MLDGLGGDHPIKGVAVLVLEAGSAQHRFRLEWKECVAEAIFYVQDEVAFELGRLWQFAQPDFETDFIDGSSGDQNLII